MTTNTYTIPEARREKVEKLIAAKRRKAERYGATLRVTFGQPYAKEVAIYDVDYITQTTYERGKATFEVFDLTIESEVIKVDGFEVVARIEHLEGGNVVTVFGGEMVAAWAKLKPFCEHCRGNHGQRVTFIVRGQDGTERQVGSTCLKDYCGIDPQAIGWAEDLGERLTAEYREFDYEREGIPRAYDVVKAIAHACDLIRERGYRKSSEPNSNRDALGERLTAGNFDRRREVLPTKEGRREAEQIVAGLKAMDEDEAINEGLGNVRSLAVAGYCKTEHFGYIAYAPKAWANYQAKLERAKARAEQREAEAESSEYVGEVGARMTFKVKSCDLLTSWDTQYGTTWLYKMTDHSGNVLMWFASAPLSVVVNGHYLGSNLVKVTEVKATVKAHNERDGVKQTILTRCKVTAFER